VDLKGKKEEDKKEEDKKEEDKKVFIHTKDGDETIDVNKQKEALENKEFESEECGEKKEENKKSEEELIKVGFFELFFEGIKVYGKIGFVLRRILDMKEQEAAHFKEAYFSIFKINILLLGGYWLISLIISSLAHNYLFDEESNPSIWSFFHSTYSFGFTSILLFALYKSEDFYLVIARTYNTRVENPAPALSGLYFSVLTFFILMSTFILGLFSNILPSFLKLIPDVVIFFITTFLYSMYAYQTRFKLRYGFRVYDSVLCFDDKFPFFLGSGLIFTALCLAFSNSLVSNTIYSLLYPIFTCLCLEADFPRNKSHSINFTIHINFLFFLSNITWN